MIIVPEISIGSLVTILITGIVGLSCYYVLTKRISRVEDKAIEVLRRIDHLEQILQTERVREL